MANLPQINALLLCDQVIVDKYSGKKTLVGIFENINSKNFPIQHPCISVYANITDAEGIYTIKVTIDNLKDFKEIGQAIIPEIKIKDRLSTNEIIMNLQGLRFEHAGKYALNLYMNKELCSTKTFTLQEVEPHGA